MPAQNLLARLDLFPVSTSVEDRPAGSHLRIAGCDLESLAGEYGTPLYVYDRATLDGSVNAYKDALAKFYPGDSGLTYAGKAYLCTGIAQWTQKHDLWVDCTGEGELHVAAKARLHRENILVHGVNKSPEDLESAMAQAGTLVFDNPLELERLVSLYREHPGPTPELWFRLRPGLVVDTHKHTQTGQENSKFGLNVDEARQAIRLCLQMGLPLSGLHFHLGSHFHDPGPLGPAIEASLDLVAELREATGWLPKTLSPGGGWGVAYHESELPQPPVDDYVSFIAGKVVAGCRQRGLPLPRLQLEPGRGLVARAGVAIYRLGTVKETANRRWLLLDGGLADNPRPALYQARYSALPVHDPGRPPSGPAWLGGPFCESGDVLIENLPMPAVLPGELIAVPVSGAYQLSMASNYNGARKPAVLMIQDREARLLQRRETLDDLVRRDIPFN
jgi:diaminopimelate decarboxylase